VLLPADGAPKVHPPAVTTSARTNHRNAFTRT
jgi:hypothetical protein